MRFTAEDAFEAQGDGDPIMINRLAAGAILKQHDCEIDTYDRDIYGDICDNTAIYDAADLFNWLGY